MGEADLGEVLGSRAALIDFWGPDCAPCRLVDPVVEALAETHGGRVAFYKLNVDDHPGVAARFGVMGIPTLIFLRDGQEVRRIIGAASRSRLEQGLGELLA